MKIHFISIGGSVMHSMAIAMHLQGHQVTGSDDEIYDPAFSKLKKYGLLPEKKGWFAEKITKDIDIIVLGMHAKADNPELQEAQQKGLRIVSFPQFVYQNSLDKTRIVVAGSHGKTTITSMLMHVFKETGKKFDFLVGSNVAGFENSFQLSQQSEFMIIEGDEYLSSAINPEPKFLWYKPHIAIISGIAWDHFNVFPTFESYIHQFERFIASLPQGGHLVYDANDNLLTEIVSKYHQLNKHEYNYPEYHLVNGNFFVSYGNNHEARLQIFGRHNLLNLNGARLVSQLAGISEEDFFRSIQSFTGAGKRLEKVFENGNLIIFRDFAHAPSKVSATISGIKHQFPERNIIACIELHTYSSLNRNFIPQYAGTTEIADTCAVFINEEAVNLKGLSIPGRDEIIKAFDRDTIEVFYAKNKLIEFIKNSYTGNDILLLMSSGNFDGLQVESLISQ